MSQTEIEHPKGEPEPVIFRTSGERTAKMMAIMLGICVVGGAIFFGMWDYWISSPAPVVIMRSAAEPEALGLLSILKFTSL